MRLAVAILLISAPSAMAQTVRGRVLMPDGATPAVGIVVTATASTGTSAGRALTTSTGGYVISLKAAGTYDIRALRIGFPPTVVRVTVAAGANVNQDIVLTSLPVSIEGMKVTDESDCSLKGKNAQIFLTLLDQTRAALGATSLWEQSGDLRIEMVRVEGHIDATYGDKPDSLYAEVDTAKGRHFVATSAFGATPPETLNTVGYMRGRGGDQYVYDMPSAEVLLSDAFVGTHCFSIRSNDDRAEWIGLGFKPRKRAKNFVDIRGTLWIDRASAELRRLDFEYDNTPEMRFETCDQHPMIKITPDLLHEVPAFRQPDPTCHMARLTPDNRMGLGGSADFARLPSGEWFIPRWFLRTGPDEGRFRREYQKRRYNPLIKKIERCYYGPGCREMIGMHARLVTVQGVAARVLRGGVELYRDTTAQPLIDAIARKRGR